MNPFFDEINKKFGFGCMPLLHRWMPEENTDSGSIRLHECEEDI